MRGVLVDAGPLVAAVSSRDAHHASCSELLKQLPPPLITTWAVLAEVNWLLRKRPEKFQGYLEAAQRGVLAVADLGGDSFSWLARFLEKYRDLGVQLADATLVYLAEKEELDTVFTLDRRDFSVFRFGRGRKFKIIPGPKSNPLRGA